MRLLLVEDDGMIGETVLDQLRRENFAVDWVRDGATASSALQHESYDLVILDLGLPKADGLEVLKSIRNARNRVPVLIATARDSIEQRIEGLDAGADDYLVKPYDLNELLARTRALLRRSFGRADSVYEYRHLRIDTIAKEVLVEEQPVALSAREWAVLEALIARPGTILSRTQLEDKLFAWKEDINSNAVEVYVHGLRKKLGNDIIQTIRGLGYVVPKA